MSAQLVTLWRDFWCRFDFHPKLDVIQSFGSAQHIGCPSCGRHFGMHRGMQTVVPWSPEFDELYEFMGYDTRTATARWQRYVENMRKAA